MLHLYILRLKLVFESCYQFIFFHFNYSFIHSKSLSRGYYEKLTWIERRAIFPAFTIYLHMVYYYHFQQDHTDHQRSFDYVQSITFDNGVIMEPRGLISRSRSISHMRFKCDGVPVEHTFAICSRNRMMLLSIQPKKSSNIFASCNFVRFDG